MSVAKDPLGNIEMLGDKGHGICGVPVEFRYVRTEKGHILGCLAIAIVNNNLWIATARTHTLDRKTASKVKGRMIASVRLAEALGNREISSHVLNMFRCDSGVWENLFFWSHRADMDFWIEHLDSEYLDRIHARLSKRQ